MLTTFHDKDDEDAGENRCNEDEVNNENEEEADDDLLNRNSENCKGIFN